MSVEEEYYYDDPGEVALAEEEVDEEGARYSWKVASWIIVALTLILNIVIVGVIIVNRNANSVVNKGNMIYSISTRICRFSVFESDTNTKRNRARPSIVS